MTEVMEDKVKKERMTYKDHVKYIEKVRPVLMMEQEILKSDERKKALFTFRQMKKKGLLTVVPTPENNWSVAPSFDYSLDILKYDGYDFEQLKEDLLKDDDEEDEDDLDEEREDGETEEEPDPEFERKIAERQAQAEKEEMSDEEIIELLDNKKKEKLSKKRIQSIETYKKYKEWLDKVRPELMRARRIKEGERYLLTAQVFSVMKRKGKIKEPPSNKNNWSIEFTDSFLASEQLKEEYREQKENLASNIIAHKEIPKAKPKPKSIARSNNAKRKQEFIELAMSAGMTAEEAEEYWKREK